ncbi:Zn-dependent protease [Kribbella sp. VKM Ac-2571]|uniref:site-2 protease family protein n=1 Tax=Kribbella sp. VKM Ac-2571 TaxID=2512222 RepID=UPI00105BD7B6|nr:site-2 protease family protein [Kribbella sp. VKM Ac-2571]TDO58742.1 Zn-dependent protease [Kribbella sp. VKM Ac-2571]
MNATFRFGRIAGIPIGAHWSVLLMVLIVSDTLASNALPQLVPGHSAAAYWSTAVLAAVVFVASLLAHELAHALTARRLDLPVERITLWMLGGVSVLGGDPATPRAAFLIAGAGPATSIGLGVLGGGGGLLLRPLDAPDLLRASVWWLAVMNVALGVFNLLPGVPLDGGRLLRALLWQWYGDPDRATVLAAIAGRVVGGVIGALGVVQLLNGDAGGLWLIAVGYVIVLAAVAEGRQARAHGAPARTTASQLMRAADITGKVETPVGEFLARVLDEEQLLFPIIGPDGRATGVVSLRRLASVPSGLRSTTTLGEIQVPLQQVPVVSSQATLADLQRLPVDAEGVALVSDGLQLVGLITGYDITRATERATGPAG